MLKKNVFILSFISILAIGYSSYIDKNANNQNEIEVIELLGTPVADFSDEKRLVGYSDNVFTGTVLTEGESIDLHIPTTLFEIKVEKSFKGKLDSEVIKVSQYGGYEKEENGENILYLLEDDQLLRKGELHLFSTKKQDDGTYHIISNYGHVKINNKEEKNKVERKFIEAYKNEVKTQLN